MGVKLIRFAKTHWFVMKESSKIHEFIRTPSRKVAYVNEVLDQGADSDFLSTLRSIVQAEKGMSHFADSTGIHRETLYKMLSENGNPTLSSMNNILHNLGLQLSVKRFRPSRFVVDELEGFDGPYA